MDCFKVRITIDFIKKRGYAGYAGYYAAETWIEADLESKADVEIFKQLLEIDKMLLSTEEEIKFLNTQTLWLACFFVCPTEIITVILLAMTHQR